MDTLKNRSVEELRELQENAEEIERLALESREVGRGQPGEGWARGASPAAPRLPALHPRSRSCSWRGRWRSLLTAAWPSRT